MKGLALMLMKAHKAKVGSDEMGDDEEPSMPPMEEIAQELIDAVKAGDAGAVAKALKGAMACAGDESDEGDDE